MKDPIHSRIARQFKEPPKWAEDFSIENVRDTFVSRRDFIRFLSLVSLGFFTGTLGVLLKSILKKSAVSTPLSKMKILNPEDIAVGESYVFNIPGKHEPAILVKLSEDKFVAYSQKCTHLQCPILWKKAQNKLVCPCHQGAFSVETGEVLYGPPERPLPQIELELKPRGVYFVGMKRGNLV